MRLELPDGGKITLDNNITLEEKQTVVEELILEWSEQIEENWEHNSIKFFLDNLASYLVWHKEEKERGTEDKKIMSIKKIEEMVGIRRGRSVPFTSLSKPLREGLGFEDDIHD